MREVLARTGSASPPRLTYVIGTYPVSTTTFIDREIRSLRRMGVRVNLISLRRPRRELSQEQRSLGSGVHYVLPVGVGSLLRSHLGFLLTRPRAYASSLLHLLTRPHPSGRARLRTLLHFGLGVHVARIVRDRYPTDHLHAHFVDRAALVTLVAGRLLQLPYSATAHANDIYVDPVLLPEKLGWAKFVATCSGYNASHLRAVSSDGNGANGHVRCIYHGIATGEYRPGPPPARPRPLLLAVGQLKEKKGFAYLLEACRMLEDEGLDFDCHIVGEGPLRPSLEAGIDELSLGSRVRLLGALPHDAVTREYREAAIFVLPCVTATDGDRDGIPNVILEAMAMRLPVVSTRHSGIPEAVEDGRTGLLVPPADATALAAALGRLLEDEALRERFGRGGRRRVAKVFDVERNVQRLLSEFVA